MKEYIERAVAIERARNELDLINKSHWSADEIVDFLKRLPAADVVEVRLLDDGTLIVTTDKYPNVTRVFVEDGKTSGSLFYAEEV